MHCSENANTVINFSRLGFQRLSTARRPESEMYFEIFGALFGIFARALSRIQPEFFRFMTKACAVFVLHGAIPEDRSVCKMSGLLLISCINSRSCTVDFDVEEEAFRRIQRPVDVARTAPFDPSIISPERYILRPSVRSTLASRATTVAPSDLSGTLRRYLTLREPVMPGVRFNWIGENSVFDYFSLSTCWKGKYAPYLFVPKMYQTSSLSPHRALTMDSEGPRTFS